MENEIPAVPAPVLTKFCCEVFEMAGLSAGDAAITADVLIAADLRGIDSHGIARLHFYLDGLQQGLDKTRGSCLHCPGNKCHCIGGCRWRDGSAGFVSFHAAGNHQGKRAWARAGSGKKLQPLWYCGILCHDGPCPRLYRYFPHQFLSICSPYLWAPGYPGYQSNRPGSPGWKTFAICPGYGYQRDPLWKD